MNKYVSATDLASGDRAPQFSFTLERADLVQYAGAAGDFHPLHTDDAGARSAGFDGVFAHGMLPAGLLATAIERWVGIGNIREYQVRFVAKSWPGETFASEIVVTSAQVHDGEALVGFDCRVQSESGVITIAGHGLAAVPVGAALSVAGSEGDPVQEALEDSQ